MDGVGSESGGWEGVESMSAGLSFLVVPLCGDHCLRGPCLGVPICIGYALLLVPCS